MTGVVLVSFFVLSIKLVSIKSGDSVQSELCNDGRCPSEFLCFVNKVS